jgi:hypothetical protein
MDQLQLPELSSKDKETYEKWWSELSLPWRKAYNEVYLRQSSDVVIPITVMHQIHHSPALRFAGPKAPYPNMSFELTDLSGVLALHKMEIFVFTHQHIDHIRDLAGLQQLRSLFLFNNQIKSLEGIQSMKQLKELYINFNEVGSLKELKGLTKLETLYCNYNTFSNFEGIGKQHAAKMKNFYCLPNDNLSDATCIKFENTVGIRCKKG